MTSSRRLGLVALCAILSGCGDREPSWIRQPYHARAGDDPSWASPALDDRGWQEVNATLLPGTKVMGWDGIGWFRLWLDVPPELAGRPVPLLGQYVGAAEIFVDGARQIAIGDPAAVVATGATPVDFDLRRPRWITFSAPGRHLVAVRFASRHVDAMHRIDFPGGFQLALGALATGDAGRLVNAGVIGATLALVLLHLLLFLFHRDRRENLHYALAVTGVAVIAGSQLQLAFAASAREVLILRGVFGAAIALSSVALLRFYYSIFAPRLPRVYWAILAVACGLALAAWTLPKALIYGFAALVSLEQARVLVSAARRRVNGAWIIATGGALWVVGGMVQMLGDTGVLPAVPDAYLYGFFALLGSISMVLARDIARDKKKYRTIFENTGTATIIFDEDEVISLANDEWAALTGYSRAEIEGRMTWRRFFSEPPLAQRPRAFEAQVRDRRGQVRDGVVTVARVPGTSERVGAFLDVTELKRAQQQVVLADKMAALGKVIAGVAHEINNPNNFIHFNLPILRRYIDAMRPLLETQVAAQPDVELLHMRYDAFLEDLFKLIENMEHGSQRITAIVADLRSYIRGGEDVEMAPGSIAKVVERVMTLVGKQVQKMVKRFDVDVSGELPPVRMNAGKIEQVLINLVVNAGQAADKEASWIKLSARAAGDAVEVLVEDNGSGIAPESLPRIFEPFFTSKGRDTGTGLGLSITHKIVEDHGGRIEVTSQVGQGSCFTVRLPAGG